MLTNWQEQAKGTVLTMHQSNDLISIQYHNKDSFSKEVKPFLEAQALATAEQLRPIWIKEGEEAALKRAGKWMEDAMNKAIPGYRLAWVEHLMESLKQGKLPGEE